MKILKGVLFSLAILVVVVQFIRPPRNEGAVDPPQSITAAYPVPGDVQEILRNSCFDCHSNNTRYPWYAEVQPVGWFLNSDITEGKKHLNFSEFAGYRQRLQLHKLDDIADQVSEGEMPLPIYTVMHADARLSPEQRNRIVAWTGALRDTMKARFSADSLGGR